MEEANKGKWRNIGYNTCITWQVKCVPDTRAMIECCGRGETERARVKAAEVKAIRTATLSVSAGLHETNRHSLHTTHFLTHELI